MNQPKKLKPLLKLVPTVRILPTFIDKYLFSIIILIMLNFLLKETIFMRYGIAVLLIYVIYVVVKILIEKIKAEKSEYLFFEDGVIIIDNIKKDKQTIIAYKDIEDIITAQSYVDRFFNIGNYIIKLKEKTFLNKKINLRPVTNFQKNTIKLNEIFNNIGGNN